MFIFLIILFIYVLKKIFSPNFRANKYLLYPYEQLYQNEHFTNFTNFTNFYTNLPLELFEYKQDNISLYDIEPNKDCKKDQAKTK
jgi:hypothetical protein